MNSTTVVGSACIIADAIAFVGVLSYLAARFDSPRVLDGDAAEVLARLRGGGSTMRAVRAIYAFLPPWMIVLGGSLLWAGDP